VYQYQKTHALTLCALFFLPLLGFLFNVNGLDHFWLLTSISETRIDSGKAIKTKRRGMSIIDAQQRFGIWMKWIPMNPMNPCFP
jgi:hypothetical protein